MSEHLPSPEQEEEPGLAGLPEALGYRETEELSLLRERLVVVMKDGGDTKELMTNYLVKGGEVADETKSEQGRLGLEVQLALIRRAGGRADYTEDLEDAYVHALQIGLDDVAAAIADDLDQTAQ